MLALYNWVDISQLVLQVAAELNFNISGTCGQSRMLACSDDVLYRAAYICPKYHTVRNMQQHPPQH
jgi:hypothetical protein